MMICMKKLNIIISHPPAIHYNFLQMQINVMRLFCKMNILKKVFFFFNFDKELKKTDPRVDAKRQIARSNLSMFKRQTTEAQKL